MSESEPALLRGDHVKSPAPAASRAETPTDVTSDEFTRGATRRDPEMVHVAGFWKRFIAAMIDLAIVIPVALLISFLVSKIAGLEMAHRPGFFDIDLWIDLLLATDPALVMAFVMFVAIGLVYLLVSHIVLGRTLGMRVMRMRVIDVYGDRPSPARCAARCAGYLASAATLFLGFLWMGFDSEKRALQDWIAGTYVVRA